MKKIICTISICLLLLLNCNAQTNPFVQNGIMCNHIIKLIKEDSIIELSKLVKYPLRRENPLPDIETPEAFILYYPVLFDSVLKKDLTYFAPNSEISPTKDGFGLEHGVWIDDDKITVINYSSNAELKLKKTLEGEIKRKIYPGIRDFSDNVIVGETDKYLFRIDDTSNDSLRYVSWRIGHSISEKPDIVLYGTSESMGSGNWETYTFKNGDWTYEIDDSSQDGWHLNLYFKGVRKSHSPFKQTK